MEPENDSTNTSLTAEIVSAYVSSNKVSTDELPDLIRSVHHALTFLPQKDEAVGPLDNKPAVPIERSICDSHLICLEDGQQFKSLKRHLRTHHKLSPEQYREKWGLPPEYPMVAPDYSLKRSKLARKSGLGKAVGK